MFDMFLHYIMLLIFISTFCLPVYSQNNRGLFIRGRRPLPIDGQWNSWAPWSECYLNTRDVSNFYSPLENFYIQKRNRTCDNPKPVNGGKVCPPPSHRFKQCACMNPLGMRTKLINDTQITSLSYLTGYPSSGARLGSQYKGWCSRAKRPSFFKKSYLEIDFKKFVNVGAIDMINNDIGRVTYYKVKYSLNGKNWENIAPQSGSKGLFIGNLITGKVSRANFSRHKVMKHLRIIPTRSFNRPCLKIEPIGCTFTCGGLHTASFGKISANSRVDIDQNCLWRIEVLNTSALSFDLTTFDVLCKYGYLDFHDGSFEFTNAPLVRRICLKDFDQHVPLLKINSNMVWLNFVSNSSDIEDGFTLKYFSECKQTINLLKGESKVIKSPNYPNSYFGNMNCSWTINAALGEEQIDISFQDFSVSSSKDSCSGDFLKVISYINDKENILGNFCDAKKPQINYTLTADKLFLQFKSDPVQKTGKGFSMLVQSGEKLIPTTMDSTTHSIITVPKKPEQTTNKTFVDFTREKKKKTSNDDSDWTIIIVSAFSAIVFLLIVWVLGVSMRRFINNRNEVEAHCKKVKAQNEEKLLKEQKKSGKTTPIYQPSPNHVEVLVTPTHTFAPQISKSKTSNDNDNEELHDNLEGESSHLLPSPKAETVELQSASGEEDPLHSPCAEVDTPLEYDSSVQVHSPIKSNSTSDLSVREGNNNSDIESCV